MRETTMKQRTSTLILMLGLAAVLAGCSADSPTAPTPSPTPGAMSITLESSASSAEVKTGILVTARVTRGGQAVPDNTSVTFTVTGGGIFADNSSTEVVRTTTGGAATVTVTALDAAIVQVTARVPGQAISKNLSFFNPVNPRTLAIYGVQPDEGSAEGGQPVTIRGRGFALPLEVIFTIDGISRSAQVAQVNSAGTEMVVITPKSPVPITTSRKVDITVIAAAGTAYEVTETIVQVFTFTTPAPPGAPSIYQIVPSSGLDRGGEQVTIYGSNFYAPLTVRFGDENVQVVSIAPDRASMLLLTPKHSRAVGSTGPEQVDVSITTEGGTVVRANGWTWLPPTTQPGFPVLYQVSPNRGTPRGGEQVTLRGSDLCGRYDTLTKNCLEAPEVRFAPAGYGDKSASVLSYSADGTQLTVITPMISANPVLIDVEADISVTNPVGSTTLNNSFTFVSEAGDPQIFSVSPNRGSARGGDTVTIYGKFFIEPVQVEFSVGGLAVVTGVSADKTEITVKTPAASVGPIGEDVFSNITVRTQFGTGRDREFTLVNGFLFLADEPTPELFALSPNSGPVDGNTRVTITGQGFQTPVQVYFGDRQAQVITSNYYQVICMSPSITPSQPGTPTTLDVTVLNLATGKRSNALPFRFGEAMFLSAISPNRGPADAETTVTIYGQGFVGPVEVVTDAAGTRIQANVLSVSGTEIRAKIQPLPIERRQCGTTDADVTVTNINSNISASGITFYYESPAPLITSIEITGQGKAGNDNTVAQYIPGGPGACALNPAWGTYTVRVRGANFQTSGSASAMVFSIPGVAAELPTTVLSSQELTFTLPDLTGVVMQEISCITGTGTCGLQYVQTPVALTLRNLRNGCTDTLDGAIVILPCDASCRPVGLTSLTLTGVPATSPMGSAFGMNINFAPSPLTSPVTVNLTYVGFTGSPTTVTIPANLPSPWPVAVTPGTVGSGNILAQSGTGVCAVSAVSSAITITAPVPTVASVTPNTGPAAGGTAVTIAGNYFTAASAVTFGGVAATSVVVVTDTQITCATPAKAAGAVAVAVTTPSGTGTLANGFTYTP